MTLRHTLEKFNVLKSSIEEDGKVDINEVNALLEFIEPYCCASSSKFCNLKKVLRIVKADGKVSEEESKYVLQLISEIQHFLRIERIIDWIMSIGLLGIVFAIAYAIV